MNRYVRSGRGARNGADLPGAVHALALAFGTGVLLEGDAPTFDAARAIRAFAFAAGGGNERQDR